MRNVIVSFKIVVFKYSDNQCIMKHECATAMQPQVTKFLLAPIGVSKIFI